MPPDSSSKLADETPWTPTAKAAVRVSWLMPGNEPALDDLMADPIVQLVMQRDHLEPAEVRGALMAASRKRRAADPS